VKDKEREAELKKLRALSSEAKVQVQSLKEENTRKAQLLAKMKETKLADNEIIDRSTKEAADNDATAKRSVPLYSTQHDTLYHQVLLCFVMHRINQSIPSNDATLHHHTDTRSKQ
jgi:hypothetical protein